MSKYLGLRLGRNSIGWTYADLTRTEKRTLRRKYQRELIFKNRIPKKETTLFKIKYLIKTNIQILILTAIISIMFMLSFILPEYWQLFFNLGMGGLISILTLKKVNKL